MSLAPPVLRRDPPFSAIVFDLDGTLADSAQDIRDSLVDAFAALQLDIGPRVDPLIDGSPLEEIFAAIVPGGNDQELREFVRAYRDAYGRIASRNTRLYPGVRSTLDALTALRPRVPLAVATNKREASAHDVLTALGVRDRFDVVVGSGGAPIAPKPAPDLLLAVAERLDVAPAAMLMVGDTLRDIQAGRRAGMRTAAVMYGLGSPEALVDARPDYLLEEFDELLVLVGLDG